MLGLFNDLGGVCDSEMTFRVGKHKLLAVLAVLLLFTSIKLTFFRLPRGLYPLWQDPGAPALLINTQGCYVPDIDPYHPIAMPYYVNITEPYECPGEPNFINFIAKDIIDLNYDIIESHYKINRSSLHCTYWEITRSSTDTYRYGPEKPITFGVQMKEDYIYVECKTDKKESLSQFVSLFPDRPDLDNRTKEHPINPDNSEPLNVIIIGIDSISKINFKRHFKKTHKFLRETLDAVEFYGHHKVDDNTFPNLIPFLTGHFKETYWDEYNKTNVYFDDADLIWYHYKKQGYRTMYLEDMTAYATFNFFKKKGFKEKPVDYYYRPMSMAMEASQMAKKSKTDCFNDKMQYEVLWDYLRKFTKAYDPSQLLFAFTFVSRITHNDHNYAAYSDRPAFELLRDMYDSNFLNRTFLIFFSDHGVRVGSLRKTLTGFYEERMPMVFFVLPQWFRDKYPTLYANLKHNERKLTTHFDIHATLYHFLNFKSSKPVDAKYKHGISLFGNIPETRTCEDAAIAPHWCCCRIYQPVLPNDTLVKRSVSLALDTINSWLNKTNGLCLPLEVTTLHTAARSTQQLFSYLLITFETQPGGGIFEVTIKYDPILDTLTLDPEINRVNNYGSNGWCLTEGRFEFRYCYCA